MKWAFIIGFTQCVKTRLLLAMLGVRQYQQWLIKEHFFGLGLADIVLFVTLASITFIPVKADYLRPVNHACILSSYTYLASCATKKHVAVWLKASAWMMREYPERRSEIVFYPRAAWQRCIIQFHRNVFSYVPRGKVKEVARMLKAIHASEDKQSAQEKNPGEKNRKKSTCPEKGE